MYFRFDSVSCNVVFCVFLVDLSTSIHVNADTMSANIKSSTSDNEGDIDLGLGSGLRPGSLPPAPPTPGSAPDATDDLSSALFSWSSVESLDTPSTTNDAASGQRKSVGAKMSGMLRGLSERLRAKRNSQQQLQQSSLSISSDNNSETGHGIHLGSSLRQQKMLFEKDLEEIKRRRKVELDFHQRNSRSSVSSSSMIC